MHNPVTATTSAIDRDTAPAGHRPPAPGRPAQGFGPGTGPRTDPQNRDELGRALIGVFARHGVRL